MHDNQDLNTLVTKHTDALKPTFQEVMSAAIEDIITSSEGEALGLVFEDGFAMVESVVFDAVGSLKPSMQSS